MKNLLETLDQASREAAIIEVMDEWDNGFDASAAWTGTRSDLEDRVMSVFSGREPKLTGTLYRGQGLEDSDFEILADGGKITLYPTKNMLTSWTWSPRVASRFAKESMEHGFSSVVLSIDASKLTAVADIKSLPFLSGTLPYAEEEVIVVSETLELTEANVIETFKYEGDLW